ncbi:MAG TPA: HAMP domain-containing sensor histidine kinase [Anaeromyxobacter sp.]|nr:HAMP domain-containing sensor histidine kinase [Anaeromyxobacter sp.]
MQLTRKFLLALVAGNLLIVAASAALEIRREIALFDSDMREDAFELGRSVRLAVRELWRAEGEEAALSFVREEAAKQEKMGIRWVWLDSRGAEEAPRVVSPESLPTHGDEPAFFTLRGEGYGPGVLFTYLPVTTPIGRHGAIEIEESLAGRNEYLRTTIEGAVGIAASYVVLSSILAAVLGFVFVGRPTRLLVEKARRIGSGDLGGPVRLKQRDELSVIAEEINAMCDRLRLAGERAQAEASARHVAVEQLRHADRLTTVGKLASGIAHELGTPINVVVGRARMIASEEVSGFASIESARIIAEQAVRMGSIIRQLLDFARRRSVRKEPRDLVVVVDATVELLAHLASKSGVALSATHQDPEAIVAIDDGLMQQVVTNLVMNGIQASPPGGSVTVGVSCRRALTPADLGGQELDCFCLSVDDSGHGMDPSTLAHAFEPFFTTKGVGEGTGLGLSVAYGIVRDHGGWITAQSRTGRGSTFSVYLPKAEARP